MNLQMGKFDTRIYKGDPCFKYIPKHNYQAFAEEIQQTEKQIIKYMPSHVVATHKNYNFVKKAVSISFWAADIVFITYCHKIKIINRIFSNRLSMFIFRMAFVVGPLLAHFRLEQAAQIEHYKILYSQIQDQYRTYKNTGDILQLNNKVQLFDIFQIEKNQQQNYNQIKEPKELQNTQKSANK